MKFRVAAIVGVAAVAATIPFGVVSPAAAEVPRIPITCGMVVRQDAHLYLNADLHCDTEVGVSVQNFNPDGSVGPIPRVTVDLQGHTLRGSGRGRGVTAFSYPGDTDLTVMNGRIKDWRVGVGGDSTTVATDLVLADNTHGFFCNGRCVANEVDFRRSGVGMNVGGEGSALVKRSTFWRNQTGASVPSTPNSLVIEDSLFVRNDVGASTGNSVVSVSSSFFFRNDTAVLVADPYSGCADLDMVTFVKNHRDLVGPAC